MPSIHSLYDTLLKVAADRPGSQEVTDCLLQVYAESEQILATADRRALSTNVAGKTHFAFEVPGKHSRAVNADLYLGASVDPSQVLTDLAKGGILAHSADEINRAIYKLVMAFCAAIDLTRPGARQTQGTFFERVVAHMASQQFGVPAVRNLKVLNMDRNTELPTDLTFDLGPGKPKFHVPVKTSTRERVIQVWAHQRIIDGVFGVGRFLGLLVCLAETHVTEKTGRVQEICLVDQWRIYQLFIAQMKRIYYLDVPVAYADLGDDFPRIHVKTFGEFFHEADIIIRDA